MTDRLATARWEPQNEVSRRYRYDFRNFWLGRAEDGSPIGYSDDRHICLVSGSRGGKGTSIIVNNLAYWPGSAVVIDPKGENATVTAARRGQGNQHCTGMGQAVHVLDPFETAQVESRYRSAFNPLDALDRHSEESIDEASRLANALVVVKDDRPDPFFDEAARSMVRALILHVLTANEFEAPERTLLTVRDLLKRGEWRIAEAMRAEGAEEIDPPHQLLWRSMEMNPAFNGVVAGDGTRFLGMMTNSAKTFESVLQTALINTEFLDSPGMRRSMARSDFRLAELKTSPAGMTLYLSLPQRYMDTHYRWLRMMVALTVTEMEKARGRPATGFPVLMMLDEFAGLKRMSVIENAVAQIAGFGVKLFFVLQSLEQLKATYKESWETFLSNAGLKIFFSVDDHFTRDYVSKLMGETEIIREVRSSNEGTSETESFAEGRSQSSTRSHSTTRGRSESFTTGTSDSVNRGTSYSRNHSTSDTISHGTNRSTSHTQGSSSGVNYRMRPWFIFWQTVDHDSISYSNSRNSSNSVSEGTSESRSRGTSQGESFGSSEGFTRGRSQSRTTGSSYSETYGTSETTGTSETRTRGTGRTSSTGRSETIHRRPLLRPEEMGQLLARVDGKDNPMYPGFALVLITGGNPVVVQRSHYYEDAQFIDCFSPHPDHQFTSARSLTVRGGQGFIATLSEAATGGKLQIGRWQVHKDAVVATGEALFRIGNVPRDGRTIAVRAPCCGKLTQIVCRQGGEWPSITDGELLTVKFYPGQDGERIDPFAEVRAACAALELKAQPRQVENPALKPWLPYLGVACVGLSAAVFNTEIWLYFHDFGLFGQSTPLFALFLARSFTSVWSGGR